MSQDALDFKMPGNVDAAPAHESLSGADALTPDEVETARRLVESALPAVSQPEAGSNTLIRKIWDHGEQIDQLRQQRLAASMDRSQGFSFVKSVLGPPKPTYRSLINEEARVSRSLFVAQVPGEAHEFFYLGGSGLHEWVWHRHPPDNGTPRTTYYEVHKDDSQGLAQLVIGPPYSPGRVADDGEVGTFHDIVSSYRNAIWGIYN